MRWMLLCASMLLLTGCGTPSFLVTPVQNVHRLQEIEVQPGSGW
jgi:hypothetical protein